MATQLYFIAREAVYNAICHGTPNSIGITLECIANQIKLSVSDDGGGRLEELEEGLGLRSMRYRARTIGGALEITDRASARKWFRNRRYLHLSHADDHPLNIVLEPARGSPYHPFQRAPAIMTSRETSALKRVFLIDDHPLMRAGMAKVVEMEQDFEVCGELGCGRRSLDLILTTRRQRARVD